MERWKILSQGLESALSQRKIRFAIYHLLNEQKQKSHAVICVGEDLDVLLALCDRILVLADGKITGIVDARTTTKEEIGLLMTSHGHTDAHQEVTA